MSSRFPGFHGQTAADNVQSAEQLEKGCKKDGSRSHTRTAHLAGQRIDIRRET